MSGIKGIIGGESQELNLYGFFRLNNLGISLLGRKRFVLGVGSGLWVGCYLAYYFWYF